MFARNSVIAFLLILMATWLYDAGVAEPRRLTLDHASAYVPRLPRDLDGFRIVQLSDMHMTHYDFRERRAAELAMSLKPDMIVLTGDFVGGRLVSASPERIALCQEMLRDLHAPAGVWAVLGNNDETSLALALRQVGVRTLSNRAVRIQRGRSAFWLVGLRFPGGVPDLTVALADVPPDAPKLIIAHTPDAVRWMPLVRGKIDLALFGHTHGGQIRLPLIGPVYSPIRMDLPLSGPFLWKDVQGYTNQGIGMNWLPLRYRCPPQVSVITLRAGLNPATGRPGM